MDIINILYVSIRNSIFIANTNDVIQINKNNEKHESYDLIV